MERTLKVSRSLLVGWTTVVVLAGCGLVSSPSQQPASNGGPPAVVVNQSFSEHLVVRPINLTVGQSLWVTGSTVCTGLLPNQKCDVLFITLTSEDNQMLEPDSSANTYEGLPAQEFVARSAGKTALTPTGPCSMPACSQVAVFAEHLAVTISS